MSIAMALYVAELAFPSLVKVVNQTKAMLDSWSTVLSENKDQSQFFNPQIPQANQSMLNRNQPYHPTRNDYEKYRWLFSPK
jgi:hypothetical protein